MLQQSSRPVLLLNSERLSGHENLTSALLSSGIPVDFRGIDEIAVDISSRGVRIYETVNQCDLRDYALVQVLSYPRPTTVLSNSIADYLDSYDVRAVGMAGIGAPTKLFKYVRLANQGLPVPSTTYRSPRLLVKSYPDLVEQLDVPFVLKTVSGGGGRATSLISTEMELIERVQDAENSQSGFLAQEFVPPDGSYFLLVLGGRVSLALQRDGIGANLLGDHMETELVDSRKVDQLVEETALAAAASLGYEVAGVHLVRHWTTGRWCVLDVDPNPPICSGKFAADKVGALSAYLRRHLISNPL